MWIALLILMETDYIFQGTDMLSWHLFPLNIFKWLWLRVSQLAGWNTELQAIKYQSLLQNLPWAAVMVYD